MEFAWDARKDWLNAKKHGISFETAILVFNDPFHVTVQDREVEGEARWQTIGMANEQLLLVAHTVEEQGEDEELIRILSARSATRQERSIYAHGH